MEQRSLPCAVQIALFKHYFVINKNKSIDENDIQLGLVSTVYSYGSVIQVQIHLEP